MSLLPAACYDVYRGGSAALGSADCPRPPIGASPGELRLWLKQHGELDKEKQKEEARVRSKNRRESGGLVAVASADGVVKSGRRAGQRPLQERNDPTSGGPARRDASSMEETVKLRQALSERTSALKASGAKVAGLEAKLKAMAAELAAARAEAEAQSAAACEVQEQLAAQGKAEQARVTALGERVGEITHAWEQEQRAFARYKAQHPEGDVPPEEEGLPLGLPRIQPLAALEPPGPLPPASAAAPATPDELGAEAGGVEEEEEQAAEARDEASCEVYSEDEVEEEEEE